jgi:hypothetical protein
MAKKGKKGGKKKEKKVEEPPSPYPSRIGVEYASCRPFDNATMTDFGTADHFHIKCPATVLMQDIFLQLSRTIYFNYRNCSLIESFSIRFAIAHARWQRRCSTVDHRTSCCRQSLGLVARGHELVEANRPVAITVGHSIYIAAARGGARGGKAGRNGANSIVSSAKQRAQRQCHAARLASGHGTHSMLSCHLHE